MTKLWSNINFIYLLIASLLFLASQIISTKRLELFFKANNFHLSFYSNLKLYFIGMFYNFFIPGGIGGDAFKVYILNKNFGILVRNGLHCAPCAHQALGTRDRGLVRLSPGFFNTENDMDLTVKALQKITAGMSLWNSFLCLLYRSVGFIFLCNSLVVSFHMCYRHIQPAIRPFMHQIQLLQEQKRIETEKERSQVRGWCIFCYHGLQKNP